MNGVIFPYVIPFFLHVDTVNLTIYASRVGLLMQTPCSIAAPPEGCSLLTRASRKLRKARCWRTCHIEATDMMSASAFYVLWR